MRDDYQKKIADKIAARYRNLELRIMEDIVRRIKKTGEITSTADWQINRLKILGYSSEDIENVIKDTLNASYPEMFELYDKIVEREYVRDKDVYEQVNAQYIPYEENEQMQQNVEAIIRQSKGELENITGSLGFYLDYNGRKVLTPLAEVYTRYLDTACYEIVSGAFDYGSVLRRTVTQLTNSGLRKIDYASGRADRVDVAARRAVLTGVAQICGKMSNYNAEKLGAEFFEVDWHSGARPTHAVWQGRVYSREQLYPRYLKTKSVNGFRQVLELVSERIPRRQPRHPGRCRQSALQLHRKNWIFILHPRSSVMQLERTFRGASLPE